jgi:DNA polymerase III subunit gamma/tau
MNEYQVLARKYRPQTFDDLVGQEVLVRTLSNAIDSNRLAHAFVLTGIRGIGKTTTARIMAKALNCIGEDGTLTTPTIKPCGVCSHCVQIKEDRHIDVMEMDAASNTGVDNARDLIESSHYKPVSGRYKVYIIDEAHMLSNNAFNALLKTLEEPPANVVFIFATTELRKIPVTILSRCQRFDLRRLSIKEMSAHLSNIAARENVNIEAAALDLVAIASEGSVRDALSLLDQAISHSQRDDAGAFHVKSETLRNLLGLVDRTRLYKLLHLLLGGEIAAALTELQSYYEAGANIVQLMQDLLNAVHDISRVLVIPNFRFDNSYSEAEQVLLKDMAASLNVAITSHAWQILSKGLPEVASSNSPLRAAEMLFIRLSYSAGLPDPRELLKKMQDGEVPNIVTPNANPQQSTSKTEPAGTTAQIISFPKKTEATFNDLLDIVNLCEENKEMILANHLKMGVRLVELKDNEIIISEKSNFPREMQQKLVQILNAKTEKKWRISLINQSGESTINEQIEQQKISELNQLKQHELVKIVLEQFDGAELVAIK